MKNNEHHIDQQSDFPLNNGKNPFDLPADYFESFEYKLKQKLELEGELLEYPVLASVKKTAAFTVPFNYFQAKKHALEYQTELASYHTLKAIQKPIFSELETDYINQLHTSLTHKIDLAKELKDYHHLFAIDKLNAFQVSENYFESVPNHLKDKIYSTQNNRISFIDKVFDFLFEKKMALSFGVFAILAISLYFYQTNPIIEPSNCQTLACLEKQDILRSSVISNFNEEQLMDMVNIRTLDNQLKSSVAKTDSVQQEEYILDNINTDQLLEEL